MSEQTTEDEILKLVGLVDRAFKYNWVDVLFRGGRALPFFSLIVALAFTLYYLIFGPPNEGIFIAIGFAGFMVGFFTLMLRSGELQEHPVLVNCRRFCMCVEENQKPLFKALIKMKAKNPDIDLKLVYNLNDSMFSKERLLEMLYE